MTNQEIKLRIIMAATAFDIKAASKSHHNTNALGIYFERIDAVMADIEAGADPRKAVMAGFSDRLCDAILRRLGFQVVGSIDRQLGGTWHYQPVALPA